MIDPTFPEIMDEMPGLAEGDIREHDRRSHDGPRRLKWVTLLSILESCQIH